MAKDGTNRGGARPGAGRPRKALTEKISEGKTAEVMMQPAEIETADVPPVREFMQELQRDGTKLLADEVYTETYQWLKERSCEKIVSRQLVEQYAMSISRWIHCEQIVTKYGSDMLIVMKSMFKYAVRTYHIYNPMEYIKMPRAKTPEITLLDEKEQTKLQEYIGHNQNKATLGVALSMTTGIRIGELCALQWQDIDLEKRILTVSKTMQRVQIQGGDKKTKLVITEPKSESSRRKIPIPKGMIAFLEKFKSKDSEHIVSGKEKPIEPRAMQYRFQKILKNVKLPSVHFHALRHIFASTCIKLGFDVKALSELLGHSTVELTLNRYVHSSFEQKIKYMERLAVNF